MTSQVKPFSFGKRKMQLIPSSNELTMTSLEIAELVEARHDSVKRTIDRLVVRGVIAKPPTVAGVKAANGVVEELYLVIKRDSFVVVAQLSPEFTARLVDRWQELEASTAVRLPSTYSQALRLAADQHDQLEAQKPMVEFAEAVMARGQDMSLTAAGKELGYGKSEWFAFLRENKLIIKRQYHPSRNRLAEFNEATTGMVQAGYMVVKHEPDVKGIPRPQTFVTSAGLDWLRKLIKSL